MDFLFELLAQFVLELVFDGLVDGVRAASRRRAGRFILYVLFTWLPALGVGYWWGLHVQHIGQAAQPRSMWVSLGIAAVLLALAASRRGEPPVEATLPNGKGRRRHHRTLVLRFTPARLTMLATTNLVAAAGMAWGFNGWS